MEFMNFEIKNIKTAVMQTNWNNIKKSKTV